MEGGILNLILLVFEIILNRGNWDTMNDLFITFNFI